MIRKKNYGNLWQRRDPPRPKTEHEELSEMLEEATWLYWAYEYKAARRRIIIIMSRLDLIEEEE